MRLILFTMVLFRLTVITKGQDIPSTLKKVRAGIDATNAIVEVLGHDQFSESFKNIGTIAAKAAPFLGAIGPIISLVAIFLPAAPSPEMRELKLRFAQVDAKFDQVFQQFREVKNLIEKTSLKNQYAGFEHTILSLSLKLQKYIAANTADVPVYNRSFVREYMTSYGGATSKLWNGMVEDTLILSSNIPLTAMRYYNNHRKNVQAVMKGVCNLILQGVKVELAFLKAVGLDHDYRVMKDEWDRKIKYLLYKMAECDREVKSRWHNQMKIDVEDGLKTWRNQSHSDFATSLYDFLKSKYDWRAWHVVAYNELHGGTHHWLKWCGGYHSFRKYGRNLVVASVDSSKPPIDVKWAHTKLASIPVGYQKTNIWGHAYWVFYRAEDIYNKEFPVEFKTGCTYASAGIIKAYAAVAHRAPGNRIVVTTRDKTPFLFHVFG